MANLTGSLPALPISYRRLRGVGVYEILPYEIALFCSKHHFVLINNFLIAVDMTYSPANIHKTDLNDLSPDDLIWLHLNASPTTGCATHRILSTLGLALSEVRSAAARERTNTFLPLLGLFTALEQIGNTYGNDVKMKTENADWSGIKKAIHNFSDMSGDSDECKAIYALRNSIVHNGSIASRGRINSEGEATGPFHRFGFNPEAKEVIELPQTAWDGTWGAAPYTFINISLFHILVDDILKEVQNHFLQKNLHLRVSLNELFDSFLIAKEHPITTN